ncbi:hypothetical protein D0Y65_042702 [Glycine soja]|uniref:Uncharacterized protein n=1 Tax=Glycine soja TaxID=3848 RepID=A0A445GEJ7_GLYSO|nr:hypothetical protein D0Y65_042702 [Glycine soja]
MVDYEYLKIVVGGGVSSGNNSISVDPDDTDATTFEPENRTVGIEEFSYDPNSDTFITPNNYEPAYQPPSPNQPSPPSHPPLDSEVPKEKQNCHKRRRSEYGGSFKRCWDQQSMQRSGKSFCWHWDYCCEF